MKTYPEFNDRFVAYAAADGLDPYAAIERDRARWPGGIMAGFMIWISERWAEYDALHGHPKGHVRTAAEQDDFTAWLARRVETTTIPAAS